MTAAALLRLAKKQELGEAVNAALLASENIHNNVFNILKKYIYICVIKKILLGYAACKNVFFILILINYIV